MTAAELDASSALLAEFGASEPDLEGFREIIFPDGNCVQVDLGPVTAEIHLEGRLMLPVAEFVFQLALASGMLVCSTIDPTVIAVLPGQRHIGIESRWPDFACVGCADELMAWIEREIDEGRIAG